MWSFGNTGDGMQPQSSRLVFGSNGDVYGTTFNGGTAGFGTIFRLKLPSSPGGSADERVLYSFAGGNDGAHPVAGLVFGAKGALFGVTTQGGPSNDGTVFELAPGSQPGTWVEKVLYAFSGKADGSGPNATLKIKDGALYGTTQDQGPRGSGTVFELSPPSQPGGAWTFNLLHSFPGGTKGATPSSGVIFGPNGELFGATASGGPRNLGIVYELVPPASAGKPWTETVLYTFSGSADGATPTGLTGSQSVLYGTTSHGGHGYGVIFELMPPAQTGGTWTYSVLHGFRGSQDGAVPFDGVTVHAGNLYGTTQKGGGNGCSTTLGCGVVYRLKPPAQPGGKWRETVLHAFGGPDGAEPVAAVTFHKGGFYGTTLLGGSLGDGTVFELVP